MDKRIKTLHDWGCDTEAAMARMLDDEDFYLECLNDILEDPNFGLLAEALKKQDGKTAFEAAHTLKGVLANVGLTPMYAKTVEMVEPLRAGRGENLAGKAAELLEMKDLLGGMLRES